MQALSLYPTGGVNSSEPPPPYPLMSSGPGNVAPPPPSYSASIQNRQSPTQDFRKSPSSGIYSGSTSAGKMTCFLVMSNNIYFVRFVFTMQKYHSGNTKVII